MGTPRGEGHDHQTLRLRDTLPPQDGGPPREVRPASQTNLSDIGPYWDFLHRHQDEFKDNPEDVHADAVLKAKRSEERIVRSSAVRHHVPERLRAGAPVTLFDQGTLG